LPARGHRASARAGADDTAELGSGSGFAWRQRRKFCPYVVGKGELDRGSVARWPCGTKRAPAHVPIWLYARGSRARRRPSYGFAWPWRQQV
jgi:hypothetical protein